MSDKDDGALGRLPSPPTCRQLGDQMRGIIVYLILSRLIRGPGDVCIVSIDQYAHVFFLCHRRQQLSRPEDLVLLTASGMVGVSVQAMDEHDVDMPTTTSRSVYFWKPKAIGGFLR